MFVMASSRARTSSSAALSWRFSSSAAASCCEVRSLRSAVAAAAAAVDRNGRTAQQLQTALEENRQLKLELDDVRRRLDTITNIEKVIRERENGPNTQ